MNPNIRERTSNTAFGYYAEDRTNPDCFIEGVVQKLDGEVVLTFVVLAETSDSSGNPVRGNVRGREFFESMWAHFVANGTAIDAIQGEWTRDALIRTEQTMTNLEAFNTALAGAVSPRIAALDRTPTGSYAKSKGYSVVEIVSIRPDFPPHDAVLVRFRKP